MRKFCIVILFSLVNLAVSAKKYQNPASITQVYLHLDKQVYIAGETIWFKAYILSDLTPDQKCKNLIVDLLDQNENRVISLKLPVFWGTSIGSVTLPVLLPQGFYVLAAYTLSQDQSAIGNYYRVIPVLNPKIRREITIGKSFPLTSPDSTVENISLIIKETSFGKAFKIETNTDQRFKSLSICGYMYGEKVFDQALGNILPIHGTIPTKDLPSGLLQVKVFDESKNLLCRKFSLINKQEDILSPNIRFDTLSFQSDSNNVFTITFPDSITGNFSLAITNDENKFQYPAQDNIFSAFRMHTFQIFPVVDFLSLDSAKKIDSRIDPSKIFEPAGSEATQQHEETFISIHGKAFNGNKLIRKGDIDFLVQTKDSSISFITVPVNKDGSFVIDNLVFQDTATFYYKSDNQSLNIILDTVKTAFPSIKNLLPENLISDLDTTIFKDSLMISEAKKKYAIYSDSSVKVRTLEQVVHISKKESATSMINKKYTSGLFSNTTISKIIDLINYPPASPSENLFDYLQNKIAGLRIIRRTSTQYDVSSPRSFSLTGGAIPVKIFLNEMEQTGTESVATIPIEQIALIKYFKPGTIGLPGVGISPVLAIYTKKYDDIQPELSGFKKFFKYPGYSVTKGFEIFFESQNPFPEISATLFWEPVVAIEHNKSTVIRFTNPSESNAFHIILEGFTVDGKLVHYEKVILKKNY